MSQHLLDAHFRRPRLQRIFWARPRLIGCVLFGIGFATLLHATTSWRQVTQLLIAWNVTVGIYLAMVWWMMGRASEQRMRLRAQIQDEGQFAVLILSIAATLACLTAIAFQLTGLKDMPGFLRSMHVGLAGLTILTAWFFIHTMFALHYAHDFYLGVVRNEPPSLQFPGAEKAPSYSDFLYCSFIIGTSAQTADVSFASRGMRKLGAIHSVLSFFFNTTLLALTINIAAGMIS